MQEKNSVDATNSSLGNSINQYDIQSVKTLHYQVIIVQNPGSSNQK